MSNTPWSIIKSDWNKLPGELLGGTWFRVNFDHSSRELVKTERGVYIVTMRVPNIRSKNIFSEIQNPIYIGLSTNLRKRFTQHTAGRTENALWRRLHEVKNHCSFNYCCFPGVSKTKLREYEQSLINCFGKQFNKIDSVATAKVIEGTLRGTINYA